MFRHLTKSALLAAVALAVVAPAPAFASWATHHPRRDEVNDRLRNLDRRVGQERREGDLTKAQAQYMRREDRSIRQEERDMARFDNGHLTKADQHALNQDENDLSRQIPQ
jgi:hypothetical protein